MLNSLFRLLFPLTLFTSLAQCVVIDRPPSNQLPDYTAGDACRAGAVVRLIGSSVEIADLPKSPLLRVIGPHDLVTDDFRPDRLNVHFDRHGTIVRVDCG